MRYSCICFYHNCDGDLKGWTNHNPEITCRACRESGFFSEDEIQKYIKSRYKHFARYRRKIGYPDKVHVILDEHDSIFEAERISPIGGGFYLDSISFDDPDVFWDNNTIRLPKPPFNKTLEDTRQKWDKAPSYIKDERNEEKWTPHVYFIDLTPDILNLLNIDYKEMSQILPEDLEKLILDRFIAMNFDAHRIIENCTKDVRIEIVFSPQKISTIPFLGVIQVIYNHISKFRNVKGVGGFTGDLPFLFISYLIVTNTIIKLDPLWLTEQKESHLLLRNEYRIKDLLKSNYKKELEWREIPSRIEITQGEFVDLTIGKLIT